MKRKRWYFAAGLLLAAALLWGTGRLGPTRSIYDLTGFPAEVTAFSASVLCYDREDPQIHYFTPQRGEAAFDETLARLEALRFRPAPLHPKPQSKVVADGAYHANLTFRYGEQECTFLYWLDGWYLKAGRGERALHPLHDEAVTRDLLAFLHANGRANHGEAGEIQ